MPYDLERRADHYAPVGRASRHDRRLSRMDDRSELTIAYVQHKAEQQGAVVEARNAIAAVAGRADAMLSGMLNALPIYDATDADFRAQLKQATRAAVINDIFGFQP